jgi:predicted transcriptional regulator
MADELDKDVLIGMTVEVVSAFVGNNTVATADLPGLIQSVHSALGMIDSPAAAPAAAPATARATPAQVRKSITPEALISFEDGKPYKMLRRHLTTRGLTVEEYRTKWGLPKDYPSVAPAYSQARSAMAKAFGLGQGARKAKGRPKKA